MSPLAFLSLLSALLIVSVLGLLWSLRRLRRNGRVPHWRISFTHYDLLAEIGLVIIWAAWVGRAYFNPSPQVWPIGDEYGLSIQSHFMWENLGRCGACVMWNGGINGGAPAFAELQGAMLHPLVVSTTLLFGVVNSSKLIMIGSLIIAGLAQWWLARVLELGRTARLWSAALVIVGGHLAGRMEHGTVNLVLSTAACSLILPPLIRLAQTGQRRAALQLGVISALALLAGQGYLQVGTAVSYLPATLTLLIFNPQRPKGVWKEFALAGLIALLLAGVLLVPVLHFWPNVSKLADPNLTSAQPFEYVPLNLVIRDFSFYQNESLQKLPVPYFYMSYIGWVPILLAAIALRLIPRSAQRMLVFLLSALVLTLLAASGVSLRLIQVLAPDYIASLRYPVFMAGLVVPVMLALAAWGLDRVIKSNWPRLGLQISGSVTRQINLVGIGLAIPLIWSIGSAYEANAPWLTVEPTGQPLQPIMGEMTTPSSQWAGFLFTQSLWLPAALEADLKVSPTFRAWSWKSRPNPPPYREITLDPAGPTMPDYVKDGPGYFLLQHAANEYAVIDNGTQRMPCRAMAHGGDIDVDCETDSAGTLIVQEYSWTGWYVNRNGQPVELRAEPWLSAAAPAGKSHFEFRYRPWDVPVGVLLSVFGLGLIAVLWLKSSTRQI